MNRFIFTILLAVLPFASNAQTYYAYLDDADLTAMPPLPPELAKYDHPWPRVDLTEIKTLNLTDEQFAKYNMVSGKAKALAIMKRVKVLNPSLIYLRAFSPRAYQGYNEPLGKQESGMPFAGTGPATYHVTGTTDAKVFAGHWLYLPGTSTTAAMQASATTVKVSNPSKLTKGQYVVIYDAPAGSFRNAEHAKITGINTSTKVITLTRGYLSSKYSHAAGAIMANHVLGAGQTPDPRLWAYNQSTYCPKDVNGKSLGEVMANWLAINYRRDADGIPVDVEVDGILFDADKYEFSGNGDVNNDLILDNGIINGVVTWGEGLKKFHALVKSYLPDKFIIGGVAPTRSFEYLGGTQMEEWPTSFRGSLENVFDSELADYTVHLHHRPSPVNTHVMTRLPSKTYPDVGNIPTDNKSFRFTFGAAMLDNGYYGKENSGRFPDPWYDEYAVDVVPGSPSFGKAINADDPNMFAYRGWMGRPTGAWRRLYNSTQFAPGMTLLNNGSFDTALTGWLGSNAVIGKDTTAGNVFEGTASLKSSSIKSGGSISGPSFNLLGNTEYTLCFAAKASDFRVIQVGLGSTYQKIFIPKEWVRRVIKIKTGAAGTYTVNFQFDNGVPNPDLWIDSVYVFKGNANVFSREFTKAFVIVNATSASKAIGLGRTYKRIKGTQDPINNGATVSSVTIGAWDAAILIKP